MELTFLNINFEVSYDPTLKKWKHLSLYKSKLDSKEIPIEEDREAKNKIEI